VSKSARAEMGPEGVKKQSLVLQEFAEQITSGMEGNDSIRIALGHVLLTRLQAGVISQGETVELFYLFPKLLGLQNSFFGGALFFIDIFAEQIATQLKTQPVLYEAVNDLINEHLDSGTIVRSEMYQFFIIFEKFLGLRPFSTPGDALSGTQRVLDEEFNFEGFSGRGRVGFSHKVTKRELWIDVSYELRLGTISSSGEFSSFKKHEAALKWVRGK
jgi:hypothetical protein